MKTLLTHCTKKEDVLSLKEESSMYLIDSQRIMASHLAILFFSRPSTYYTYINPLPVFR